MAGLGPGLLQLYPVQVQQGAAAVAEAQSVVFVETADHLAIVAKAGVVQAL